MALATFVPMLASTQPPTGAAEWAFEPKLDGWRALVYIDDQVTVRTRTGRNITEHVAHLQGLAHRGRRMVLDGELVADAGRAGDFYRLGPNLRASSRKDVMFVAFDLLLLDNRRCDRPTTSGASCSKRSISTGPGWITIPALVSTPSVLLDACAELDIEGVVAKRVDSPYRPGVRSGDWLKLKTVDWKQSHTPRRHRR
jgi:bifunctional non-homologous end joining protein LigD